MIHFAKLLVFSGKVSKISVDLKKIFRYCKSNPLLIILNKNVLYAAVSWKMD